MYEFRRDIRCKLVCTALLDLERLSEQGEIDLLYGDQSRVSLQPYIPYAWQFTDEKVGLPSTSGGGMNCFALLSRDNHCIFEVTEENITAHWMSERLDRLSLSVKRLTVVVLDNARIHTKAVKDRGAVWQERGLFVWFLPPYSPELNITEILWRKLKYEWLRAEDYANKETLRLAVTQALAAVGASLRIQFKQAKMV